jgi:RNA polymerase-binding transcription factor DksA
MKSRNSNPAALHVPAKWRRHYRRLQALREELVEDSAEQRAEFHEVLEPIGTDDSDRATDEFDHDLALGILAHEEDALFEVDDAIRRILDGTYGICEKTGMAIPEKRLRVVPWTRYTKEALERIEKRSHAGWPHLAPVSSIRGPAPGGLAEAPEPDDLITRETDVRKRRENIRDLAGDAGAEITDVTSFEP